LLQGQSDILAENMGVVLAHWGCLDPDRRGLTAAEVIQTLYKDPPKPAPEWHNDIKSALEALLGKPDTRSLGNKLRAVRRRIFAGRFIDHAGTQQRAARWAVYPAAEFRSAAKKTHSDSPDSPANGVPGVPAVSLVSVGESFSVNGQAHGDGWEPPEGGDDSFDVSAF
jgi:hypothetical protein